MDSKFDVSYIRFGHLDEKNTMTKSIFFFHLSILNTKKYLFLEFVVPIRFLTLLNPFWLSTKTTKKMGEQRVSYELYDIGSQNLVTNVLFSVSLHKYTIIALELGS